MKHTISITLFLLLFSCTKSRHNQRTEYLDENVSVLKKDVIEADTTNQYLYDFISDISDILKLDPNYGFDIRPQENISFDCKDRTYLKRFIQEKFDPESGLLIEFDFVSSFQPETDSTELTSSIYLDKVDTSFMLKKKRKLKDFVWDVDRLNFDTSNHKNWYSFSIPLFSKDHKIALFTIQDLCSGLCGNGRTIIFKHENKKWKYRTLEYWIH